MKVNHLMAFCDELETQLNELTFIRNKLVYAIIRDINI